MNQLKSGIAAATMMLIGIAAFATGPNVGEEVRLNKAQMEIDRHAKIRSNEDHAKIMGEHFKVPATTIQTLSAQNQGWGAVNIELALAWEMNRLHPEKYPLVTGALDEVEKMRVGGSDWDKIAKITDVKLEPVIKEARDTAKTLRKAAYAAAHRKHEAAKVEETRQIIKEDHQILKADQEKKAQ